MWGIILNVSMIIVGIAILIFMAKIVDGRDDDRF